MVTRATKKMWRVVHGDSVTNGDVVVELLPLQPF
jgi:hypothetical protein